MNELENLIKYYVDLLIIQYRTKPKARATIRAFISELVRAYNLVKQVQMAYDINTAVGAQLDTVGKYFGVVRKFVGLDFKYKYFSFQYMGGDDDGLSFNIYDPENPESNALGKFRTLRSEDSYEYDLDDEQFRIIIKLRAIGLYNHILSYKYITEMVHEILKDDVMVLVSDKMEIFYYIRDPNLLQIFQTYPRLLPAPAGVKVYVSSPEDFEPRFTLKVLQENGGTPYNIFQKGFQSMQNRKTGKWKVMPENEEEE